MAARILMVDDDGRLLSGIARHLRATYEIDRMEDPRKALAAVAANPSHAVVISDYQMPGMNGIEFLARVKDIAPDTSRILLTGYSAVDMAIRAVNQGEIFRFLTKPCDIGLLGSAVQAGVRQFQLLQSERVLLEQTLTGSVEAMIGLLEHLDSAAHRKAQRIILLVRRAASELNLFDLWPLTVAASMAQLAQLALPLPLIGKQRLGTPLSPEEALQAVKAFDTMAGVLEKVPRLGPVAEILRRLAPSNERSRQGLPVTVQILCATMELVDALDRAPKAQDAFEAVSQGWASFDPAVAQALKNVVARDATFAEEHRQVRTVDPLDLKLGHLLMEPLRTKSGRVILSEGSILDEWRLDLLREMKALLDTSVPVRVIEPLLS